MSDEIVLQNAPQAAQGPAPYKPWTRPLTYVVFGLGMSCAGFLMFCVLPYAVVMGWFALGCGIPAVLLAKKEIGRCPQAADHGFIRWGRRTGWWGIVLGPVTAVIWTLVVVIIGVNL
jgi:hypothetical protein